MPSITQSHGSRSGILFVSLSAILWGTVGIATQAIYRQSNLTAVTVGFYRLALAFPIVAFLCWKSVGKRVFEVAPRDYWKMVLTGAMLALYQVFYFASIAHIGVAAATLITLCTAPVIVSLTSSIFLRERLTRHTLTALTAALFGTVLLIGWPESNAVQRNVGVGVCLALGSASGYAIVVLLGRSMAHTCHPIHSTTVSFAAGAIFLFPLAASNAFAGSYTNEIRSLLLYVGLIPTAAAYSLFFMGMRTLKASTASIITMLEPLTATLLAWFLFGERLAASGLTGAALLLAAIAVLYRGASFTKTG